LKNKQVTCYADFVEVLLYAGFAMGGGNSEGIFTTIPWNWNEEPPYDTPVVWHTGDIETDPWEWRMRVLNERNDIAYGKIFVKKSGFVTRKWAPHFLAVRRGNRTFDEMYADGIISHHAKRIYNVILEHGVLPSHAIKAIGGFGKEEKAQFERALVELQMKMYITTCGAQQKMSQKGEEYGWSSAVFTTTENFWGEDVFNEASKINESEAFAKISEQILLLNPEAEQKKILKFIKA